MKSPAGHLRTALADRRRQSGAATLIVVMVLFFVISLVAAYAGRNIIFEQRTSSNQLQSTVAFEVADAGLEWALSMLNSGRIDDNCDASTNLAQPTFLQRYFAINADNGDVTIPAEVRDPPGGYPNAGRWPTCTRDGSGWTCSCPAAGAPTLPAPATTGLSPTFRIRFVEQPIAARKAVVRIEVNGCTQQDNNCLNFRPAAADECRGTVCAMVALSPGLKSAPLAAITARGGVDVGGAALAAHNTAADSSSVTILAGGVVTSPGTMVLQGKPGTPGDRTVVDNDAGLNNPALTADRMFAASFGVWRETYWQQPGAVRLACGGGCNSANIRDAANLNPGRVLLAEGNVALDGGGDIGSAASPVSLVVRGNLTFAAPTTIYGFVYAETANWATGGVGEIRGGVVAENQITGTGAFAVIYDRTVLDRVRWSTGSFVKVPGSWRDFP